MDAGMGIRIRMNRGQRRHGVVRICLWGLALCLAAGAGRVRGEEEWAQAVRPWPWSFPRDHGAHPQFRTEWWYFTGNLRDAEGIRHGYQLTFFRHGVRKEAARPHNPWSVRDVFLAHMAVADGASGRFRWAERASRAGPGLAGASSEGMAVWVLDWSARMSGGEIRLEARTAHVSLELTLRPRRAVVLHGEHGLSRKGPAQGQASHYVSLTDLETAGTLRLGDRSVAVAGTSWFDQEFGSNQLTPEQVGWDWFSLHISDGHDLMIYLLRLQDGSLEPASSGTLVAPDGSWRHLRLPDIRVSVLDRWKSPRSGGTYPSRWRIEIPSARLDLDVAPLLPDQELVTEGSTGVTYWEGMVLGRGRSQGQPATCEGYVELTGYAGGIGGLF
jgi:predicted secreted hydrolase